MRTKPQLTTTPACVIAIACVFSLPLHAQHRQTHKHAPVRSVSDVEARAAAAKKELVRKHLASVRSHMREVKQKINAAKQKEHQINETIGQVQTCIDATKVTLHRVNHRLTVLTDQHVKAVARLTRTEDRLASRRNMLAARLRENYERRQATYAQVILQSRTVHELLTRGYYVRKIVHSDAQLVSGIKDDVHQIQRDKKALEVQQQEQRELADQFESQKAEYAADLGKKQVLLANVQEVREQAQDQLDELESESNEMTSRIRELSEVLRQRQEWLRREAARRRQNGQKPAPGEAEAPLPTVFRGHFIRPVPGRITSGFGMRYHPILHVRKLHTGVDFGAPSGTPIHAAAAGVVLLAAYTRGYGNCIIIDHGGGIATLYGHCSSLGVSEGQSVKQGQVIGRVGATGYATGPHLHFEVRKNGVPVPPL